MPQGDPLVEDWHWSRGPMLALLQLAQDFAVRFRDRKRDDGVVDFTTSSNSRSNCSGKTIRRLKPLPNPPAHRLVKSPTLSPRKEQVGREPERGAT